MCVGPIRVLLPHNQDSDEINTPMVLIVGFDYIKVDPQNPFIATPNLYDFYFVARSIIPVGTCISFWFPYHTEPMPMTAGANDLQRRALHLNWHIGSLYRALQLRNPTDIRSYNWNEKLIMQTLGITDHENINNVIEDSLLHIQTEPYSLAPEDVEFSDTPLLENSMHVGQQQHIVATVHKQLNPGDMLHIYFNAEQAFAQPIDNQPCGGRALLHYYDPSFDAITFPWVDHPLRRAPVVPCLAQHVVMLLPEIAHFEPDLLPSHPLLTRVIRTLDGDMYQDWREIIIFTPHSLTQQYIFDVQWQLMDCVQAQQESHNGWSAEDGHVLKMMLDAIDASPAERLLVEKSLERLRSPLAVDSLSRREYDVAQLKTRMMLTNEQLAARLNITRGAIEKHLTNIYAKLGLREAESRRRAKLLRIIIQYLAEAQR